MFGLISFFLLLCPPEQTAGVLGLKVKGQLLVYTSTLASGSSGVCPPLLRLPQAVTCQRTLAVWVSERLGENKEISNEWGGILLFKK